MRINPQHEFVMVSQYCMGLGIDVGCGTNRLSPDVLAIDHYPHKAKAGEFGANDLITNCRALPFRDCTMDFVFSSHCLEDFAPNEIKDTFIEWLRVVKVNGYLVLLLPDMEGGRYPKVNDPKGNPSHRVDMGVAYMSDLIKGLPVQVVQCDTIDKSKYCTFDFVVQKTEAL